MRNVLSKKLNNRKGFTLAELLIVVAIIAVLVAIMIPVFGSSRLRAVHAKDLANVRSAYAEKVLEEMSDDDFSGTLNFEFDVTGLDLDTQTKVTLEGKDIKVATGPSGSEISDTIKVSAGVTISGIKDS